MSARVNSYDKLVAGMIRENGDSNLPLRLRTKLAEIMQSEAGAKDIFAFCEASMNALKKRDQYQPGHFILHAFKEFAKSGNVLLMKQFYGQYQEYIEKYNIANPISGDSPLFHALNRKDYEMMEFLLKNGADPKKNKALSDGQTVVDVAIVRSDYNALEMFEEFDKAKTQKSASMKSGQAAAETMGANSQNQMSAPKASTAAAKTQASPTSSTATPALSAAKAPTATPMPPAAKTPSTQTPSTQNPETPRATTAPKSVVSLEARETEFYRDVLKNGANPEKLPPKNDGLPYVGLGISGVIDKNGAFIVENVVSNSIAQGRGIEPGYSFQPKPPTTIEEMVDNLRKSVYDQQACGFCNQNVIVKDENGKEAGLLPNGEKITVFGCNWKNIYVAPEKNQAMSKEQFLQNAENKVQQTQRSK